MSKLSNLMPVMLERENILELYWLYCVSAVPVQKVRTHFNICKKLITKRIKGLEVPKGEKVSASKSKICYHPGLEARKVHLMLSCWREGLLLALPLLEQHWCTEKSPRSQYCPYFWNCEARCHSHLQWFSGALCCCCLC